MNLSEQIRTKYPLNMVDLLFAPTQEYDLLLEFDDSYSAGEKSKLQDMLTKEMNIKVGHFGGYASREVQLRKSGKYASIHCLDFTAYFQEANYLEPMCWMIHALVNNASWVKDCNGKVVSVRQFSAKQQLLALKFKKTIQSQQSGTANFEPLANKIVECVRDAGRKLETYLPSLYNRPITEAGWKLVEKRSSVMAAFTRSGKSSMQLKALAAELFGVVDVERELKDWIRLVRGFPEFEQEVQRAQKKVRNVLLYDCNLGDIDNTITKAWNILYNEDDLTQSSIQQDMEVVRDTMDCTINVDKLRAKDLEGYFAEASAKYEYAAKRLLRSEIASLLLTQAQSAISKERMDATQQLQDVEWDLTRFCPLTSGRLASDLKLSWWQFNEIDESLLFVDADGWDEDSFGNLTMNVSTQGLKAWLLPSCLYDLPEMHHTAGSHYLQRVGVRNRCFAAAVFAVEP